MSNPTSTLAEPGADAVTQPPDPPADGTDWKAEARRWEAHSREIQVQRVPGHGLPKQNDFVLVSRDGPEWELKSPKAKCGTVKRAISADAATPGGTPMSDDGATDNAQKQARPPQFSGMLRLSA